MAAFGNKTYQHSFLIAKKEIEDGRSERINFDNNIYRYDDYFVQNDLKAYEQSREACKLLPGWFWASFVPCLAKMCPTVSV